MPAPEEIMDALTQHLSACLKENPESLKPTVFLFMRSASVGSSAAVIDVQEMVINPLLHGALPCVIQKTWQEIKRYKPADTKLEATALVTTAEFSYYKKDNTTRRVIELPQENHLGILYVVSTPTETKTRILPIILIDDIIEFVEIDPEYEKRLKPGATFGELFPKIL